MAQIDVNNSLGISKTTAHSNTRLFFSRIGIKSALPLPLMTIMPAKSSRSGWVAGNLASASCGASPLFIDLLLGPTMQEISVAFPRSVGATTVFKFDDDKAMHIFLVDDAVPLFNVTFGQLRFFANADQVRQQIDEYRKAGNGVMPAPTWKWRFESGFEKSIDGKANKGWRLQDL